MPAPQASALQAGVLSRLTSDFQSSWSVLNDFLGHLCPDISKAWGLWESGLLAGRNNISGAGIGAWAGTGSGGGLAQTVPLQVVHTWPHDDPSGSFSTLKAALTSEIMKEFALFSSSYVFSTVPYAGTSTATGVSAGTFSATMAPGSVSSYEASSQRPSGLAAGVRAQLPSKWALPVLDPFLKALEGSMEEQFGVWASSSVVSGDTAEGAASPGTGAGSGTSDGDGKVA